ncbi:MAG: prepilin-type N-terminal cleavage/methylation domain-containing protein [Phycisphaeraceae bacterium]
MTHTPRTTRPFAAGFSLMEVLVALGIFALGFVAIASIFPAGAMLQRQTADDVNARHVERNARAIIQATPLDETELQTMYSSQTVAPDPPRELVRFTDDALDGDDAIWSYETRSYPSAITIIDPTDPIDRPFVWVPLLRDTRENDTDPPSWLIVAFILRNSADEVADVVRLNDTSRHGPRTFDLGQDAEEDARIGLNDWVVDARGSVYRVRSTDGDLIHVDGFIEEDPDFADNDYDLWYCPRPDNRSTSPARGVVVVSEFTGID